MLQKKRKILTPGLMFFGVAAASLGLFSSAPAEEKPSSYLPVDITESFASIMARMKADKAQVMRRQEALLKERYDLSDRPAKGVKMTGGKALQEGVRVKLPEDMSWEKLAAMTPEEIQKQGVFPKGFFPLPHPNHGEGGMVFPKFH